jgi:hypothetical protein
MARRRADRRPRRADRLRRPAPEGLEARDLKTVVTWPALGGGTDPPPPIEIKFPAESASLGNPINPAPVEVWFPAGHWSLGDRS